MLALALCSVAVSASSRYGERGSPSCGTGLSAPSAAAGCAAWTFSLETSLCLVKRSRPRQAPALQMVSGTPGKLLPRAFTPLRFGSTTPKGWLLEQLELQASGLSGHLSLFWADVMDSIWIGGGADGGLHERAPCASAAARARRGTVARSAVSHTRCTGCHKPQTG